MEPGDFELVVLPNGRVGIMIGRTTVMNYIWGKYKDSVMTQGRIDEFKLFLSSKFGGTQVIIIGETLLFNDQLKDPRELPADESIYHIDMEVFIPWNGKDHLAYVPTFSPQRSNNVQMEYDLVASQLISIGYTVKRLPFNNEIVHSPVNIVSCVDMTTLDSMVWLTDYTDFANSDASNYYELIDWNKEYVLRNLKDRVQNWINSPNSTAAWNSVQSAITQVWSDIETKKQNNNPFFEAQKNILEADEFRVVRIAHFKIGAGSLHCETQY